MNSLNNAITSKPSKVIFKIALSLSLPLIVIALYNSWDTFVVATAELHKTLHSILASHIKAVSENAFNYGGALVVFSFLYGAFHAIGPGHGKAVILTYLGTHKESMRKGIFISLLAAMLQSCIAIGLVSALAIVLKFNLEEVEYYGNNMAVVSYFMIIMLGLVLISTSIHRLRKLRQISKQADHNHSSHSSSDGHSHSHTHTHDSGCGCSHAHMPEEGQSLWRTLAVVFSMGIRPCSGAIVVLIYAHLVGVYFYGVIAALMMGIGTGLLVSVIAIAAHFARSKLERLVARSNQVNAYTRHSIPNYLRFAGGIFLVFLGWSLYNATLTMTAHQHLL